MVRKQLTGKVISNKMVKTVVVSVKNTVRHPKYGKILRLSKKYKVHDETNQCNIGDFVLFEETRPLSKTKRWSLKSIISKTVLLS
jgi:small subunit ribosomal protein S17